MASGTAGPLHQRQADHAAELMEYGTASIVLAGPFRDGPSDEAVRRLLLRFSRIGSSETFHSRIMVGVMLEDPRRTEH
jgi:hypothetical protein